MIPVWRSRGIRIELQTGFIFNLIDSQLRLNRRISSWARGWIHNQFESFSIENESNNELESPRLNLNAWTASKPYVGNGLDDYDTLNTVQTMIYVTFGRFSNITDQKSLSFLLFLCVVGSIHKISLLFICLFMYFGFEGGASHLPPLEFDGSQNPNKKQDKQS